MNLSQLSPRNLSIALGAALFLLASPFARAGFVNGGFETGDFSGWTLEYAHNWADVDPADPNAGISFSSASNGVTPIVVNKSVYLDSYVPGLAGRFVGNSMARINDINGGCDVTRLSQTGVIDASDLSGGTEASLYINWLSVMDNPGHYPQGANPWFNIEIIKNGFSVYNVTHFSNEAGWTQTGWYYGDPVYFGAGQSVLTGLQVGDSVTVRMTVADCSWSGHGAYAYLDGIGTSKVPDPTDVPDAASTFALFVLGLAGVIALKRRHG